MDRHALVDTHYATAGNELSDLLTNSQGPYATEDSLQRLVPSDNALDGGYYGVPGSKVDLNICYLTQPSAP